MKLVERYIFRRMLAAFLLSLGALSGTVWLTQALREIDLVTTKGQTFLTFLHVSALIFPGLMLIVAPVAVLIGTMFTLNQLNADSELAVINASGASQWTILKPALALGLIGALIVGSMAFYFAPKSLQGFRTVITSINADLISSFVREGQFMQIGPQMVFHIRDRRADGSLEGLFIQDDRKPDEVSVYVANRGIILKNPLGTFLIMQNGTIQQRKKTSGALSIIEFESYAFDLTALSGNGATPRFRAAERDIAYLMSPDPNDPEYQRQPGEFRAELHDRLAQPLYALLFSILPVAALAQARTTRQGRGFTLLAVALVASAARVAGFVLASLSEAVPLAVPALYALPLALIGLSLAAIFGNVRLDALDQVGAAISEAMNRFVVRARRIGAKGAR